MMAGRFAAAAEPHGEEPDGAEAAAPRALVQLHLPVNAIHLSELGYLAAASDAEQLTFIDLLK